MNDLSSASGSATPPGIPSDVLWNMFVSEPHSGVAVISLDGHILFLNEQAVRIFHGPDAKAEDCVGRRLQDIYPAEWVAQRIAIFEQVNQTAKPVLMRTIWRGRQHHTWVYPIGADGIDDSDPTDHPGKETPARFLTVTIYVAGDEQPPPISGTDYDYIESDIVDLGPLDVLSPRELEVLALIGQGMSNKQVAATLFRSVKTIDNHRAAIGTKLKVDDRVKLAAIAHRAGLTLKDAERERT